MAPGKLDKLLKDLAKNISTDEAEAFSELSSEARLAFSGIGGGPNYQDPDLDLAAQPGDVISSKYKTSYHLVGQTRTGIHPLSGYGGEKSHGHILVAGGGGPNVKEEDKKSGDRNVLGYNPSVDAASICITAKTDHRFSQWGIKTGEKERLPTSAVLAKADKIVIVAGTEDLILATSTKAKDSQNRNNWGVSRIKLNAGNVEDDLLQSVPKGEKLLEVLNSIIESIDEISSDVEALNIYLSKLNRSLMNHYHHGFAAEPTLPSFDVQKASMQMCQDQLRVAQSVTSVRAKLHMLAKNHLSPTGKNYINSRTVQVA